MFGSQVKPLHAHLLKGERESMPMALLRVDFRTHQGNGMLDTI